MDDLPQSDEQSVMQVQQEDESGLLQSDPAPCETDETKEGNGIDGKRKLEQKCMSNPQVQLKKLATEVSQLKHNGDVDSLGVEKSSCSPLKESPETESSRIPTTVEATEESLSNYETKTQESVSDCEITQKNVNSSETTERTVTNGETTALKSLDNSEKISESESNSEVTLQKEVSNCESEIQGTTSNIETSQQSISKCETKKEVVSDSETAQERVSNCELSSGKQHEEDKQSLKNETSEPRVVLTRVSPVDDEPSSDKNLSEWGSRLRVRRAPPPPPPPSPPEEEYPPPKREKTVTRTAALKKVNYCELYSSEDEVSVSSVPRKGRSFEKSRRRSSSSSEFGMSDDDYSSDDSRLRRKKRAALKKKEEESNSEGSDSDYKPKKHGKKSKKVNAKFSKRIHEKETLSEYEQLQRKNIEEKLAFLNSLNFNEMKEEFSKSKKSKKST